MGLFTRTKTDNTPRSTAFMASAKRMKLTRNAPKSDTPQRIAEWQSESWGMFDAVPEVQYATNFLGNACAKLVLYVGTWDASNPEQQRPDPADSEPAKDALARLSSSANGHAEILKRMAQNLSVTGECYLVGIDDTPDPDGDEATPRAPGATAAPPVTPPPATGEEAAEGSADITEQEHWEIRSVDEVVRKGDKTYLLDDPKDTPEKGGRELREDRDFVCRIWINHPRWTNVATSPLNSVLNSCRELLILDRSVRAAGTSRIATAGILLWPEELTLPKPEITEGEDVDEGDQPEDPVLKEIIDAATAAIADEESAAAIAPIIIRAKGDLLEKVRHISFDRPLDGEVGARTNMARERLAAGLNVPKEVVFGLSDVNHWNAFQITEDTQKAHIDPLAMLMCEQLTVGYLHPMLIEGGMSEDEAEKFVIWFDTTRLVVRPNRGQDAKDAHGEIVISDEALRTYLGFDDGDKPTEEEVARRMAQNRGPISDELMLALMDLVAGRAVAIPPPPGETPPEDGDGPSSTTEPSDDDDDGGGTDDNPGPPDEPTPTDEGSVTAAGLPAANNLGRRLANIDRTLRDRLQVAADAALSRSLEKAGGRLRSKAQRDSSIKQVVASVAARGIAAALGPSLVASLGFSDDALVRGAFDTVREQFLQWSSRAGTQALNMIPNLADGEREIIEATQKRDREEAADWFVDALQALASERLYEPDPRAPDVGEFDDAMSVPYGIVREAVARAGGSAGPESSVRAAGDATFQQSFGIATGSVVTSELATHDIEIDGYVWDYGDYPRSNPFEPHADLHGEFFRTFDDERLLNPESFPPEEFYTPGDHDGCVCDWVPSTSDRAQELARKRAEDLDRDTPVTETVDSAGTLDDALSAEEALLRDDAVESAAVFDSDGRLVLSKLGDVDSVTFSPVEAARIHNFGEVFTHNHPRDGRAFSFADARLASLTDIQEMRVVTKSYDFSLKPGSAGWPTPDAIHVKYAEHLEALKDASAARIEEYGSFEAADIAGGDELWRRIARDLGLIYKRTKVI